MMIFSAGILRYHNSLDNKCEQQVNCLLSSYNRPFLHYVHGKWVSMAVTCSACEDSHVREPENWLTFLGGWNHRTFMCRDLSVTLGDGYINWEAERERDSERDRARLWMQEREGRVSTPRSQDLILTAQPIFYLHHGGGKRLRRRRKESAGLGRQTSIVPTAVQQSCVLWKGKAIRCERIFQLDNRRKDTSSKRKGKKRKDERELWTTSNTFNHLTWNRENCTKQQDHLVSLLISCSSLVLLSLTRLVSIFPSQRGTLGDVTVFGMPVWEWVEVRPSQSVPCMSPCVFISCICFNDVRIPLSVLFSPIISFHHCRASHLQRTCEHVSVRWWTRVDVMNSRMYMRKQLDVNRRSSSLIVFDLSVKAESFMQNGAGGFAVAQQCFYMHNE